MRSMPHLDGRHIVGLALGLLLLAAPAGAVGRSTIADAGLAPQVRNEMLALPGIRDPRLQVRARDGVVTLAGTVPDLETHEEALRAALTVRNVRSVIDLIRVVPAFRDNTELRLAVERALRLDSDADARDISVLAEDGVVTLTGRVPSAQQHSNALEAVRGVRGVARVRDLIDLQKPIVRTDRAIWTDIRRGLDEDLLLQPAVIQAVVRDGVVTLTGFVATPAQRTEAIDQAWVSGVWRVKDRLGWASWAADEGLKDTISLPGDATLRSSVLAALRQDPRTREDWIDVSVLAGVVTLNGETGTLASKQAAAQDANNTPGVADVSSLLRIRRVPPDATLAARVRAALKHDPDLARYDFTVRGAQGEVYVNGEVVNEFDHQAMMRAVARVPGVVAIQDQVINNHAARLEDDHKVAWETRLWMNVAALIPFRHVTVSVKDGVAALEGQVPHPYYRALAEMLAREAGARRVTDRLHVG
jgi:osmotically-inducible protein OsmY